MTRLEMPWTSLCWLTSRHANLLSATCRCAFDPPGNALNWPGKVGSLPGTPTYPGLSFQAAQRRFLRDVARCAFLTRLEMPSARLEMPFYVHIQARQSRFLYGTLPGAPVQRREVDTAEPTAFRPLTPRHTPPDHAPTHAPARPRTHPRTHPPTHLRTHPPTHPPTSPWVRTRASGRDAA